MSALSFVKEGDEAAAQEAEQERKIIDKRPLAVILQANREAKEAEHAAKLKARDQLLTVTDDDVAFELDRDLANQRRQEAVATEKQRALDEFRAAVAERVVVAVESNSNSNANAQSSVKNSATKRPVESTLAPVLPPVKKLAVQVVPAVQVRKVNPSARPSTSVAASTAGAKKPSVSSGIGLLGAYGDSSDSDD